jgi:hypothetical protein
MSMISPDGKYEIHYNTRDDDSYFYSDTRFSWIVTAVATGDSIIEFSGDWNQDSHGVDKSGTECVVFSTSGDEVIASYFDGTTKRCELPSKVKIVDHGHAIEITWHDGRVEKQERRPAFFTTKYGEPFYAAKLVKAPRDKE